MEPRKGFVVFLTGLPAAGKSSLAEKLKTLLEDRQGRIVTWLDGDQIRTWLSNGLGFTKEDRDMNVVRVGKVAAEIARHGGAVVISLVSPYREARDQVRALVQAVGKFIEVHVSTPLSVCEARDPKGLYARGRRGEAKGVTGLDAPYESPLKPDLVLDGSKGTPDQEAEAILSLLREARCL